MTSTRIELHLCSSILLLFLFRSSVYMCVCVHVCLWVYVCICVSYICDQVMCGSKLSETVRDAYEKGYTEPRPHLDLLGIDTKSKLRTIARALRIPLSEEAIEVMEKDHTHAHTHMCICYIYMCAHSHPQRHAYLHEHLEIRHNTRVLASAQLRIHRYRRM